MSRNPSSEDDAPKRAAPPSSLLGKFLVGAAVAVIGAVCGGLVTLYIYDVQLATSRCDVANRLLAERAFERTQIPGNEAGVGHPDATWADEAGWVYVRLVDAASLQVGASSVSIVTNIHSDHPNRLTTEEVAVPSAAPIAVKRCGQTYEVTFLPLKERTSPPSSVLQFRIAAASGTS
jgi:hypothetical protein